MYKNLHNIFGMFNIDQSHAKRGCRMLKVGTRLNTTGHRVCSKFCFNSWLFLTYFDFVVTCG